MSHPNIDELTALKFVKRGIYVDDPIRDALVEAGLVVRRLWGWALTDSGEAWNEIGYDRLRNFPAENALQLRPVRSRPDPPRRSKAKQTKFVHCNPPISELLHREGISPTSVICG